MTQSLIKDVLSWIDFLKKQTKDYLIPQKI